MKYFWRISIPVLDSQIGRNFDIFNRSFARRWITFQSWQHRVQGNCINVNHEDDDDVKCSHFHEKMQFYWPTAKTQ